MDKISSQRVRWSGYLSFATILTFLIVILRFDFTLFNQYMLDRKTPPPIKAADNLVLPKPVVSYLRNDIPVYTINMGTQDIVKIEVVFFSGRPFEDKKLVARTTSRLLKEGTTDKSASEIAEQIDFYGGTISVPVNLDTTNITFYSLRKHLDALLPLLGEIICAPSFPQEEMDALIANSRQRLKIDLSKNDIVAYRKITENIFGKAHPYGYNSEAPLYSQLERKDLIHHHQKNMVAGNTMIFLSGKIDDQVLKKVDRYLGDIPPGKKREESIFPALPATVRKEHLHHSDTIQTAVRIGRRLFNRAHPDFHGMYVLNTIFGGYFGSRLMENIREKKGYTYNIFSSMDTMMFDGYFYVGTEVSNDLTQKTVAEIYHEMEVLQNDLVSEKELLMVRNYLLGSLLTMLDGPLNIINVVKETVSEGMPENHFESLVKTIQRISPQELRDLAQKYFRKEDFWELTVGKQQF